MTQMMFDFDNETDEFVLTAQYDNKNHTMKIPAKFAYVMAMKRIENKGKRTEWKTLIYDETTECLREIMEEGLTMYTEKKNVCVFDAFSTPIKSTS